MTEPVSPSTQTAEERFVAHLYGLNKRAMKGDSTARAALARLRRSLGVRHLDLSALRDVGAWLPDHLDDDKLDAYLLTAGLFALFQAPTMPSNRHSFGKALRGLRGQLSAGAESLDRRVAALLNADRNDLPYRLRQLVQMLKGTSHVPNWHQFLKDVLRWDDASRHTQRQWARDYWTS